jgi:hypothetical protein
MLRHGACPAWLTMPSMHHMVIHVHHHQCWVSHDATQLAGVEGTIVLSCHWVHCILESLKHLQFQTSNMPLLPCCSSTRDNPAALTADSEEQGETRSSKAISSADDQTLFTFSCDRSGVATVRTPATTPGDQPFGTGSSSRHRLNSSWRPILVSTWWRLAAAGAGAGTHGLPLQQGSASLSKGDTRD